MEKQQNEETVRKIPTYSFHNNTPEQLYVFL